MLLFHKKNIPEKKHYYYFWTITKIVKKKQPVSVSDIVFLDNPKQMFIFNKQNKIFYTQSTNPINTITLKTTSVWIQIQKKLKISSCFTQYLLFTSANVNSFVFVQNQKLNTVFYFLFDLQKYKVSYTAGYGNYVIFTNQDDVHSTVTFTLPSKKKMTTSKWVVGILGRNSFDQLKNFISPYKKTKLKKTKIKVRGVAKNSFDHHNGGSSNRKPLFLNLYNNIAKINK